MSAYTDVRTFLVTHGLGTSDTTQDWAVIIGGVSDHLTQPHLAIIPTTGSRPIDVMGRDPLHQPRFRVVVQGAPGGYVEAEAKANAVWDALHRQQFADFLTVEGTNPPMWLGYDEDQHKPRWSLNFTTIRK